MTYPVRDAVVADAAAIGEAHAEAWRVGYASLFSDDFLARAVDERRSRWHQMLRRGQLRGVLLVVEHTSRGVVGFHHTGPSDSEEFAAEVYGFYLHPEHWGSGAAEILMREGLRRQRASGVATCHLWTHAGAERARAFYERTGWSQTGGTLLYDFGDVHPAPLVEYAIVL